MLWIACGGEREHDELRVEVGVSPTPAMVGEAQIRVSVADRATGAPVEDARVVVTGHPPDGEGDAVADTADATSPGLWVVPDFPLAVPGEWRLEARAVLPDGRSGAGRHPIRVLGGLGGGSG